MQLGCCVCLFLQTHLMTRSVPVVLLFCGLASRSLRHAMSSRAGHGLHDKPRRKRRRSHDPLLRCRLILTMWLCSALLYPVDASLHHRSAIHIDLSSTGLTGWMDVLPLLVLCVLCVNRTPTVGWGAHIHRRHCAEGLLDLYWGRCLLGRLRAGKVDADRYRLELGRTDLTPVEE